MVGKKRCSPQKEAGEALHTGFIGKRAIKNKPVKIQ